MLRSRIRGLIGCLFIGSFLMTSLYLLSSWMTNHPNGFLRKLPPQPIRGTGFIELSNPYYYIAGNSQSAIYLGNRYYRARLLAVSVQNKDTLSKQLIGLDTVKLSQGAYLQADAANYYLIDAGKAVVIAGGMKDGILKDRNTTSQFTGALPLSKHSLILTILAKGRNATLIRFFEGQTVNRHELDQQGDGIFSPDGMLVKPPSGNKLFFVYYYRNRITCLDTNLKLLFNCKTIDTNSRVQIKLGEIKSDHAITLASPQIFVNRHCAVNSNYLFVQSALKADNEIASMAKISEVIDVYSIKDGKYKLSFYVPDFAGEKMKEFRVCGNTLVGLFDHYVYLYRLYF